MGEKVKHSTQSQLLFNRVTEGIAQSLEMPCIKLGDQICVSACIFYNHIEFLNLCLELNPICCSK